MCKPAPWGDACGGNVAMLVVYGEESNVERTGSLNIYNALPAR